MPMSFSTAKRTQSHTEEIANSISHGIGLFAALGGTPLLIVHAVQHGDGGVVVAVVLFSATTIILYLASTLYHALPAGRTKRVFRIVEHCAIYLLIAGTYTPFTLGILRGPWGWALFCAVWGMAASGIALKVLGKASHPVLSTGLYLLMGWLIVIAAVPMVSRVPPIGLLLILAGGLSYTAGIAFFAMDSRLKYGHFIWHLFVMAGTTFHYFAVFRYAI